MSAANRAALAIGMALAACGKGANYSPTDPARGFPGDTAPLDDAGSGRPDGGLADGGTLPDGGTLSCAFPPSALLALDGCSGGTPPGLPQPAVLLGPCSDTLLVTTSGTSCRGRVSGPADSFTGTCTVTGANPGQFSCTARSLLPGDIQCLLGSSNSTCTIHVCIEGRNGGCSP